MEVALAALLSEALPLENKVLGTVIVAGLLAQLAWSSGKVWAFLKARIEGFLSLDQGFLSRIVVEPSNPIYDALVETLIETCPDSFDAYKFDPSWSKPKKTTLLPLNFRKPLELEHGNHVIRVLLLNEQMVPIQKRPWNPEGLTGTFRAWIQDLESKEQDKDKKESGSLNNRPAISFNSKTLTQPELSEWLGDFSAQHAESRGFTMHFLIRESLGERPSGSKQKGKKESESQGGNLTWKTQKMQGIKTFQNVPQPESIRMALFEDASVFLKSKALYMARGQNWKRSYLLSGPPGCGKSSCIAAMAREFSLEVFVFDMQSLKTNSEFVSAMHHVADQASGTHMIVFDDFDRCPLFKKNKYGSDIEPKGYGPEEEEAYARMLEEAQRSGASSPDLATVYPESKEEPENPKGRRFRSEANVKLDDKTVSVDALLQQLDGIGECHGRIVVFAVNRPEILKTVDPTGALFREGRIDRHVRLTLATRSQAEALAHIFHGEDLPPMTPDFRDGLVSTVTLVTYLSSSVKTRDQVLDFLSGKVTGRLAKLFQKRPETEEDQEEKPVSQGALKRAKNSDKQREYRGFFEDKALEKMFHRMKKIQEKRKALYCLIKMAKEGQKARARLLARVEELSDSSLKMQIDLEEKLDHIVQTEDIIKVQLASRKPNKSK